MRKITREGLTNNLGKGVRVEREGLVGNIKNQKGVIQRGALLGKLSKVEGLLCVWPFATYWNSEGLVIDEKHFTDIPYFLRTGDTINLPYTPYSKRKLCSDRVMIRSYSVDLDITSLLPGLDKLSSG